ncbi:hypothetical protein [Sinorhizobium medicae]
MLSIYKSRHCSFDRLGKSDRESEHHVNCPLDYDTKMRLQSAAKGGGREDHRDHEAAIGQVLTGWDAFLKAFFLKVNIATAGDCKMIAATNRQLLSRLLRQF